MCNLRRNCNPYNVSGKLEPEVLQFRSAEKPELWTQLMRGHGLRLPVETCFVCTRLPETEAERSPKAPEDNYIQCMEFARPGLTEQPLMPTIRVQGLFSTLQGMRAFRATGLSRVGVWGAWG